MSPRYGSAIGAAMRDLSSRYPPQENAVSVGDVLPSAELVATSGSPIGLDGLLAGRPAVLVFYRGAWCPYCNITLRHYDKTLAPGLAERGVLLIAISPQTPDGSAAAVTNGELGFTVVSDPAYAFAGALGIVTR